MANRNITELDFDQILENFKTFLRSQTQFNDYDFDGAAIKILMDLLAYNTTYNNFYINMLASEMFLDSAVLRESVVSRAKHLGYIPRSIRSSKAIVDITVNPSPDSPDYIVLDQTTRFITTVDNVRYTFTPIKTYLINPTAGVYSISDVELIEGQRLTHRFTVNEEDELEQRFILPNKNIDETSIIVTVQESATNTNQKIYTRYQDINELTNESTVYFLQEIENEQMEIYFGDGVIGKKPVDGNVIIVDYVVSNGDAVEGASIFSTASGISGYSSVDIETKEIASDSSVIESINSIKKLAPLNYETQNRAVTKLDYETLLKKDIPEIEFIRVWGGEDNDPPYYGRVYISAKPYGSLTFTTDEKELMLENYVRPRSLISVEAVFVDPEFLQLVVSSNVLYNSRITNLTPEDVKVKVLEAIQEYKESVLRGFDADFRYSTLVKYIDSADQSIISNLTDIKIKYRIYPPFNVPTKFEFTLNNQINKGDVEHSIFSVDSTSFAFSDGIPTYIKDDGNGNLEYYRLVNGQKITYEENAGTVDYSDGHFIIESLDVASIPSGSDYVDIIVTPEKYDVIALREQIITLNDDDIVIVIEDINEDKLVEAIKLIGEIPEKYKEACLKRAREFDTKVFIDKLKREISKC